MAVLGVAVLIVAIIALRSPKRAAVSAGSQTVTHTVTRSPSGGASSGSGGVSGSASTAPSSPPSSTSSSPTTAVGSQPLVVLNQGLLDGTASTAATRFRDKGWTVTRINENYVNNVITTTAYYDPTVPGAFLAARALHRQFPTIHRVSERFSNLPPGPVVVVLTSDYSPG